METIALGLIQVFLLSSTLLALQASQTILLRLRRSNDEQ